MPTVKELYDTLNEKHVTHILCDFFDGDGYETAADAHRAGVLLPGVVCPDVATFTVAMRTAACAVECVYSGRSYEVYVRVKSQKPEEKHPTTYGEFCLAQL